MVQIILSIPHMLIKTLITLLALTCFVSSFHLTEIRNEDNSIPWPFTDCGTAKSWTIDSLTMSILPARNTNNDIDVLGTVKDSVSFKRVDLIVKFGGAFLHSESIDYVQSYDSGDTLEFRFKNYVPSFAPSGNYALTFTFINTSGNEEGCLGMTFKI